VSGSQEALSLIAAGRPKLPSQKRHTDKKTKNHILLATAARRYDGVTLIQRFSLQEMIFNVAGLANIIWFMSNLPSCEDIRAQFTSTYHETSVEDHQGSNPDERADVQQLPRMTMKENELLDKLNQCVHRQRLSISLLHRHGAHSKCFIVAFLTVGIVSPFSLLFSSARNVKEMLDISGYQLLARIVRKHHWHVFLASTYYHLRLRLTDFTRTLDENLLSLMFNFVGLRRSRPQPHTKTSVSRLVRTPASRETLRSGENEKVSFAIALPPKWLSHSVS